MADWTGNSKSVFTTLGASNHSEHEREKDDYYATDPKALELLLELEQFNHKVWECACGAGHLSKVLEQKGYDVKNTDIVDRGAKNVEIQNFLNLDFTRGGTGMTEILLLTHLINLPKNLLRNHWIYRQMV